MPPKVKAVGKGQGPSALASEALVGQGRPAQIEVTASVPLRRRAGFAFSNSEVVTLDCSELTDAQIDAIKADRRLVFREVWPAPAAATVRAE